MFNFNKFKKIQKSFNGKICVVVKNRSLEEIIECLKYAEIIGVNRWQEFNKLFVETRLIASVQKDIQFHFIGHLQKNKVKDVVQYFGCIQSVDSLELLKKINSECEKLNKKIDIMLQINISDDPNKFGFKIDEINHLLVETRLIASLHNIQLIGFMTITAKEEPEKIREDYRAMKKIFNQYQSQYSLTELSMGMSGDYEIAMEEGATMVRIGTTLFK